MEGLFSEPEKLVLLWCPGLSGLVAGVPSGCRWVSLGVAGCRRGVAGCCRGVAGVPLGVAGV